MRNVFGTLAIALIVCLSRIFWSKSAASQQAKYWIDQELDKCLGLWATRSYTAFAYSPIRLTYCASSAGSLRQAESEAIRGCMKLLVDRDRKAKPCKIIYSGGKVTDASVFTAERRDERIPMIFEIYDGVTGTKEVRSGHLVIGKGHRKIRSEGYQGSGWDRSGRANAVPERPVTILIGSKSKICQGHVDTSDWYSGNKKVGYANASFEITCFGQFDFTARNVRKAGLFKDGSRYLTYFEPIFEFEKSYIKATIR